MYWIQNKILPFVVTLSTALWAVPPEPAERYPHEVVQTQKGGGIYAPFGESSTEPPPQTPSPPPKSAPPTEKTPTYTPEGAKPGAGDAFTPATIGEPKQPGLPQPAAVPELPPFKVPKTVRTPMAPPPVIPVEEILTRTIGSPLPAFTGKEVEGSHQPKDQPETVYSINYNNVPIIPYIRFVSKISGTSFVFNEDDLQFNVTIVSEEPTTVENIMSVLLQVLQTHGLAMTEQGNQLLIYKLEKAQLGKLATVVSSQEALETQPPIITRVFRLSAASPTDIQAIIKPMLSKEALVAVSESTGHLIVTDVAGNIRKIDNLLKSIDSPTPKQEIALYSVHNTEINSLIALASKILMPLGADVTLVPQTSTNTIFVIAPRYAMQQTLTILRTLDTVSVQAIGRRGDLSTAPELDGITFQIYKLQYHRGDELVEALRDIATSLEASGAVDNELINTISTIQWIQSSNSLVISGSSAAIDKVKLLVQDLDIPLNQVIIEVLVIQTNISNTLSIGVEWGSAIQFLNPASGDGQNVQFGGGSTQGVDANGVASPLNARLNPNTGPSPWPPLAEGATLGLVGRFLSFNNTLFTSIGAFINALQADQNTKILLNPKQLTQDNHTARLFVGQNFAFRESTVSEPGSTILAGDIQYRDVGTELIITPIIGDSDVVTLEISLSIGRLATGAIEGESGITTPVIKTETETRISVPDDYFLILSGSIADQQVEVQRGLPCLGGLPILGAAFSTQQRDDTRDNLILFIRPHIIRTKADMVRVTEAERTHYEHASKQDDFQLDASQIGRLLNINCFDETNRHGRHDHYFDPCYDNDPCDAVCCD